MQPTSDHADIVAVSDRFRLPSAEKQYLKLDAPTRRRIKEALRDLEAAENPLLHPRMRPLTGALKGDYRLRVGGWRVLMSASREERTLHV